MKTFLKTLFLIGLLFCGLQDNWAASKPPDTRESALSVDQPDEHRALGLFPSEGFNGPPACIDIPPLRAEPMRHCRTKANARTKRFQGPQNYRSCQNTNTVASAFLCNSATRHDNHKRGHWPAGKVGKHGGTA